MSATGVDDIYLLKLTNNGDFLWSKKIGGISNEYVVSMTIDVNGAAVLGGYFANTTTFNSFPVVSFTSAGLDDAFVVKFESDGTHAWTKTVGNTGFDRMSGVTTDAQGNVYATGFFQGTVDLNPDAGVENYTSDLEDGFVIKLSASGEFLIASVLTGPGSDYSYGIATDAIGGIYTCGSFTQTIDFDPSSSVSTLTSIGGFDAFLSKWSQCVPLFGTDVQAACDQYTWIDGNTYTSNNNSATAQITSVAGCDSTVTLNLTITAVNVGVTVTGNTLSANMSGAQYQWVDCNNNFQPVFGATQSSFTPASSGSYAVEVSSNGCSDMSTCYFVNTVGFDELQDGNDIEIFPNPSNGNFQIRSKQLLYRTSIRVLNELGVLVFDKVVEGSESIDFDLNQPAGVYFIELIDENSHRTARRIVVR
jgi:hypothetical protein